MELEATEEPEPRRAMFKFEFQEDTANNENKFERERTGGCWTAQGKKRLNRPSTKAGAVTKQTTDLMPSLASTWMWLGAEGCSPGGRMPFGFVA